jgi:cell shape-determining protein MreD
LISAVAYFFPNILNSVILGTYLALGNNIDIPTTFTVGIFIGMLYTPLYAIPAFFASFVEFMVSMKRIEKFLDLKEVPNNCLISDEARFENDD